MMPTFGNRFCLKRRLILWDHPAIDSPRTLIMSICSIQLEVEPIEVERRDHWKCRIAMMHLKKGPNDDQLALQASSS
jgi:hypothetical protein